MLQGTDGETREEKEIIQQHRRNQAERRKESQGEMLGEDK